MAATGCDALGLEIGLLILANAGREVGAQVALQGNLDPSVLFGSDDL